jgi:hypothetical protein
MQLMACSFFYFEYSSAEACLQIEDGSRSADDASRRSSHSFFEPWAFQLGSALLRAV